MIIKIFRPDGTPDLNNWRVACDIATCTRTDLLVNSDAWLVPNQLDMPSYCPACLDWDSYMLITRAVYCPGCGGSDDIDFCANPHICCRYCGAYLVSYTDEPHTAGLINGWRLPPANGW